MIATMNMQLIYRYSPNDTSQPKIFRMSMNCRVVFKAAGNSLTETLWRYQRSRGGVKVQNHFQWEHMTGWKLLACWWFLYWSRVQSIEDGLDTDLRRLFNACGRTHAYPSTATHSLRRTVGLMDAYIMPGTLELSMTASVITDLKVKILLGEEIWFWVTEW